MLTFLQFIAESYEKVLKWMSHPDHTIIGDRRDYPSHGELHHDSAMIHRHKHPENYTYEGHYKPFPEYDKFNRGMAFIRGRTAQVSQYPDTGYESHALDPRHVENHLRKHYGIQNVKWD